MLIVSIGYTAPLHRIDGALAEHREWLDVHYGAGVFVASGPKDPRTGGVILAVGTTREALERIVAADPFHRDGLATHTLTEFRPNRLGGALAGEEVRSALA